MYSNTPGNGSSSAGYLSNQLYAAAVNPTTGVVYMTFYKYISGGNPASTIVSATPSNGGTTWTLNTVAGNYQTSATTECVPS